ncbi:Hypothetical predicted protein [Podarcis lilfordi]|uniref:Uncharacterized protein n=1 Tax=Podarcis lilfordi TaxID=74358 RepID=A0AA35KMY6_9SAUR|nr:Hypothetical predicted protein [Podarcis lilfordi]
MQRRSAGEKRSWRVGGGEQGSPRFAPKQHHQEAEEAAKIQRGGGEGTSPVPGAMGGCGQAGSDVSGEATIAATTIAATQVGRRRRQQQRERACLPA